MKIKNISNNDLVLSLSIGNNGNLMMNIKPNQVMYCEESSKVNKQLIIYEKKKLISITSDAEKPEYVGYYKPYFESGTYQNNPRKGNTSVVVEIDEDEDEDVVLTVSADQITFENIQDSDDEPTQIHEEPVKRGRGRPKKPVTNEVPQEKKKRGRPKGSTKKPE